MHAFKTPLKASECRRDGECGCKMCRASIHATMDLRPSPSTPFASTFTRSKIDSDSDSDTKYLQSHPISRLRSLQSMSSSSSSSSSSSLRFRAPGRLFLGLVIVCVSGFLWPNLGKFREAMLTPERFIRIAEGSLAKPSLLDRLEFLQDQMWMEDAFSSSFFSSTSNCTETANWRLIEDVQFLHSSCTIYSSHLERVSIWGYAAKSSGVLWRSLVNRTFVTLAGRVMEWQEGQIKLIVHPEGSSWTMKKWTASAIALDENTWVLEYKRTVLCEVLWDMHILLESVHDRFVKVSSNVITFLNHMPDAFSGDVKLPT